MSYAILYRFLVPLIFCSAVDDAVGQVLISVDYSDTLVVKQHGSQALTVLTGHADPVIFGSKAYITLWNVDSIEQLNAYLRDQSETGIMKPLGVDERRSTNLVVDTSRQTSFSVFGSQVNWIPSGNRAATFDFSSLTEPIRVGLLNQMQRVPPFDEQDLVTVDEYVADYEARQKQRVKETLEYQKKRFGIESNDSE